MNRIERIMYLAIQNYKANNKSNTSEEAEMPNPVIVPDFIELNTDASPLQFVSGSANSVPCADVPCALNDVQLVRSSSSSEMETSYRIEHNSSTKLKLRKIANPIYREQKEPSEEDEEELWGEDSDEYVPSESETSSADDEITDQLAVVADPSDSQTNASPTEKTGNPFVVKEKLLDFIDLKSLSNEIGFNCQKNLEGGQIMLSEIKAVKFVKGSDQYFYKHSYKQTTWEQARSTTVGTRRSSGVKSLNGIIRKPAYNSKIPLSENKKRDLQTLLTSNIIPKYYEPFFSGLF